MQVDVDEVVLGHEPDAVPRARRFAAAALAALGRPELADDAALVVTELVTNALLHGAPPVVLRLRPVGDGVRVEVFDGARAAPVRGLASPDAMTGRGLALVRALSAGWGVDAAPDGKTVWADLPAEPGPADAGADAGEVDVDALLADWDDLADERHPVYLGDVPTDLLVAAKAHVDNLVREFVLAASGAATGRTAAAPAHLATLIETVVHRFADARDAIKRQALAAVARGQPRTELSLTLPVSAADAGEEYLAALDQVDTYARAARLLTLETPPQHRVFRRWYVESLVAQLRAAAAGRTPPAPETFERRLLDELGALATAQRISARAARLQSVTTALAAATTEAEVAQVVVSEGVRALGASGGGVLLVTAEGRLDIPAAVGYAADVVRRLRAERRDADLPAAVALRTGEPVWLESRQERDSRFPALTGLEPGTISMCAVPLALGGRRLGALRFSFDTPRLFDEAERGFVLALAAQTAEALERNALYAAERQARAAADEACAAANAVAARLTRLHRVAAELARADDPERVADIAVRHAAHGLHADAAAVYRTDGAHARLVRARGLSADLAADWEALPAGLPADAAEPAVVPGTAGTLVGLPLRVPARPLGVLALLLPPDAPVDDDTLTFLRSLAALCALGWDRVERPPAGQPAS